MLIALEEVENAFVAYRQAQLRLHEITEAEKAQQRAVSQDLVRVYKALGGGWEEDLAREHVLR